MSNSSVSSGISPKKQNFNRTIRCMDKYDISFLCYTKKKPIFISEGIGPKLNWIWRWNWGNLWKTCRCICVTDILSSKFMRRCFCFFFVFDFGASVNNILRDKGRFQYYWCTKTMYYNCLLYLVCVWQYCCLYWRCKSKWREQKFFHKKLFRNKYIISTNARRLESFHTTVNKSENDTTHDALYEVS